MKQKILLLMIAVVTTLTMTAQQTRSIKVGDYDDPTQVYNGSYFDFAPTNFYVAHTGVQMIYTPDLLADMNGKQDVKINSLAFKFSCNTGDVSIVRDVKIYLQEIDATAFAVNDGVKQFFDFTSAQPVEREFSINMSYQGYTLEFEIPDGFAFTPGKSLLVTIVFDAQDDNNCTMGSDYAPFYKSGIKGQAMTYTDNWNSFVEYARGEDFPNATATLGCGTNVELPVTEIVYSYTPPTVITEQPEGGLVQYYRTGWCIYNSWFTGISEQDGKLDVVFGSDGKVYIKNISLWYDNYNTWVEGTYDAETHIITIPTGQYLSWDDSSGYGIQVMWGKTSMDEEGNLVPVLDKTVENIRFLIDEENETITLLGSSGTPDAESPQKKYTAEGIYTMYSNDEQFTALEFLTSGKVLHPAVPADPTADDWYDCGDESGYSKFSFTLPTTDVDGNLIDPEYLSYSIYTDGDQLFTFDSEHYSYDIGNEDITEVPYSVYNSGYDFHNGSCYFYRTNEGDNPLFTERIGIQVHYTVDGVKNSSEIVYWTLPTEPAVPADPIADDWYDKGDETGFSKFSFTLPTTDVDGNPLYSGYLSYSIYTDDDQLFTFDSEHYSYDIGDEDITEVPHSVYSSGYDFHNGSCYFYRTNEGNNPLFNYRIGIQVHYTVDGVKNSSDIVYVTLDETNEYSIFLHDKQDNSYTLETYNQKKVDATLQGRTIYADGRWNTLCLPFDHTLNQDSPLAGFEVRGLDTATEGYTNPTGYEKSSKTLWLNFKDPEVIEAGKPCLVRKRASDGSGITDPIVNPVFKNVTIDSSTPVGITSTDGTTTFLGVYSPVTFEKGTENRSVLFLQNGNLYYPNGEEATTIGAFRAYFQLNGIWGGEPEEPEGDSGVHSFVLNFGDGETAIQEIVNGKSSNGKSDEWYSVDGRKLEGKPTQKGIYIVNGKKMLIK